MRKMNHIWGTRPTGKDKLKTQVGRPTNESQKNAQSWGMKIGKMYRCNGS